MFESSERSLTEEDRTRLLECMSPAPSPFWPLTQYQFGLQAIGEAFGVFCFVAIVGGLGTWPAVRVIAGGIGFLTLWWLLHLKSRILSPLRHYRELNQRVWDFQKAVNEAQTARVRRVESDAVVEVMHDQGVVYLFDVGTDCTYWIDPYCFMTPGRPPKEWPSRSFEVFQIPGCKDEIGPFPYGKRLRARQTFEFQDLFQHFEFEPPPDGLIRQSLDEFVKTAQLKNRERAGMAST
jgi:hypothetical protein